MRRGVEIDYREVPDEAERLERVARVLSEGVYAYLKKRGLLAAHGPKVAETNARGATSREAKIFHE